MAYIAVKPCCFNGKQFFVGEDVPDEFILSGNEKNLIKMGKIAVQGSAPVKQAPPQAPQSVKIDLESEDGIIPLDVTLEGLQAIFDALTGNVKKAEEVIQTVTNEDALILLHATDNRKSVKELAEERAKTLQEAGE